MRTLKILLGTLLMIVFVSCNKTNFKKDVPDCIRNAINDAEKPMQLWEWRVAGNIYYYLIVSSYVDAYSPLYDENCNIICAPSGGFGGGGDGECPEFLGQIEKTLIWENDKQ
jgi:hypothetical protein